MFFSFVLFGCCCFAFFLFLVGFCFANYEGDHYLLKADPYKLNPSLQIAKSLLSKAHTQLKQAVSSADEVKDQVKNKDSITTAYMAFVSFCDNIMRQKDAGKGVFQMNSLLSKTPYLPTVLLLEGHPSF